MTNNRPRILTFDVETSPVTAYVWSLWDQNVGLNQIKTDWRIVAWAAKWYGDPASKIIYRDNRGGNIQNDKALVKDLVKLLEQADIVITQNGEAFDLKKVRARAVINGLPPMRPVRSTDILKEGRKVFSFTSHKLAYVTETLNKKYKKTDHREFPGFELWAEILKGNGRAWRAMERYCKYDVLATEETYSIIQGWIRTQNLATYQDAGGATRCKCGSERLENRGYVRTDDAKYRVYRCRDCGKWPRGKQNLLSKQARKSYTKEWK